MIGFFYKRAFVAGLVLCVCTAALSGAPGFWQAATQADFLRGEVDQLSIDEHGRLTLGPELTRIFDPSVSVIWTMAVDQDGTAFLGTGNDGKVFKVTADGKGALFYDSPELEVHALALARDGALYVGTSPDGQIYKVARDGTATPFFDPEDKYIWSLAVDSKGTLFAATGDKGTVYRIDASGKGEPFFATKATHAMTLAFDRGGALLIGTGSPGRVFRVDPAGKGFLALDTPYQEVRALRVDAAGLVYAAAQNARSSTPAPETTDVSAVPEPEPVPNVSTEIMAFAIIEAPVTPQGSAQGGGSREPQGRAAGAVYRIQPDGLWDTLWESRDDAPYDISIEPNGSVLVATGGKGKVFRLSGEPIQPVLVTRVPAEQATMFEPGAARTLLVTANPGLLVAISNERASTGSYESDVKDARMVASWGAISWRATTPPGTKVELFSRSGNTRVPDEAWSDWSPAYTVPEGSPITSPKARYLQWRAVLTGGEVSPVLTSVSAAYLQRNVRPQVTSITVYPPGVVFQKPFSTGEAEIAGYDGEPQDRRLANQGNAAGSAGAPALGRRIYQKGLQTFAWKAEDDNGDELAFDVLYRREGETEWRPLKTGLADTLVVWDTSSAPNGTYVLKIVASDTRSNPSELMLRGELESESFEIDNTPPLVTLGAIRRDGKGFVVPLGVKDADSALTRVEYSLDAQRWQTAFPVDGILDARQETFEIRLEESAAGRMLVVRATDSLNNVGSGQIVVRENGR